MAISYNVSSPDNLHFQNTSGRMSLLIRLAAGPNSHSPLDFATWQPLTLYFPTIIRETFFRPLDLFRIKMTNSASGISIALEEQASEILGASHLCLERRLPPILPEVKSASQIGCQARSKLSYSDENRDDNKLKLSKCNTFHKKTQVGIECL